MDEQVQKKNTHQVRRADWTGNRAEEGVASPEDVKCPSYFPLSKGNRSAYSTLAHFGEMFKRIQNSLGQQF